MQLTRAADYAVRIMIHLATLPTGARPSAKALAEAGEIPEQFVGKVLQSLARFRLITAHRGMNGGFTLAVSPEQISILDVVEAMEGPTHLNVCMEYGQGCSRSGHCPAHHVWVKAQEAMTGVLKAATIASLAEIEKRDQEAPSASPGEFPTIS